jgi:hypothetical protein
MTTSNTLNPSSTSDLQNTTDKSGDIAFRIRIPTLQDFIVAAQRLGAKLDSSTQGFINRYEKLGFAEKFVLGQIPFAGDTIDLAIQGYKAAKGQKVDPVIIGLSSLGLGADVIASATFGGLQGINASVAVVKAAYQTMGPVAKASVKAIFEAASSSPTAMKALREAIPELASLAKSGKLSQLLENAEYATFVRAKIVKGSSSIGESIFKNRSKDNEKIEASSSLSESKDSSSLAQQRYDATVANLNEEKVPITKENIESVLSQTNLSSKSIDDILEVAKQVTKSNAQLTA